MVELWFALLAVTLTIFVVLDGWNLGAAAMLLVVTRDESERRQVLAAIGPLWSWNEVWLVGSGGILALAFPRLMALILSGFYLAIFLFLWMLILRGIAIEVRGHVVDRMWSDLWDVVLGLSSAFLAALVGLGAANLIRGVPVRDQSGFFLSLFTDFGVRGQVGLIDWYTLSVGAFFSVVLCGHGCAYLSYRTIGNLHARCEQVGRKLWWTGVISFGAISYVTYAVRPQFFTQLMAGIGGIWAIAGLIAGVALIVIGRKLGSDGLLFAGSCCIVASLCLGVAVSLFPRVLQSTLSSGVFVSAYNGTAGPDGLAAGLRWWPISFLLAATYFVFIVVYYRGKAKIEVDTQGFS